MWSDGRNSIPCCISGPCNCRHLLLPPAIRSSPRPNLKESFLHPLSPPPLPSSSHLHHLTIHLQLNMKLGHCWLLKNRGGKGKNSNFTVGKPAKHGLNQVMKAHVTGMSWGCPPFPNVMWWEGFFTYVVFLPQTHNSSLTMRKNIRQTQTEGHCIGYLASTPRDDQNHGKQKRLRGGQRSE